MFLKNQRICIAHFLSNLDHHIPTFQTFIIGHDYDSKLHKNNIRIVAQQHLIIDFSCSSTRMLIVNNTFPGLKSVVRLLIFGYDNITNDQRLKKFTMTSIRRLKAYTIT